VRRRVLGIQGSEGCIEGWLVEAPLGGELTYFIVKGYEHPDEGVIAIPYRMGARRILDPIAYTNRVCPWILKELDCMPRPTPIVNWREVIKCIDPIRVLKERLSQLPESVRYILGKLDYELAGLTGSWALGLERESSDIDILVYGDNVYGSLVALAEEGLIKPCPPRLDRVREPLAFLLYPLKLVEACWAGVRVTLRILRWDARIPCRRRIPLGRFRAVVKLIDIGESYLVPARYRLVVVKQSEGPRVERAVLETWRTRYQEMPPGIYEVDGVAWIEEDSVIVSPDIEGKVASEAWEPGNR
jgi:predicted nucleotidyltransferase